MNNFGLVKASSVINQPNLLHIIPSSIPHIELRNGIVSVSYFFLADLFILQGTKDKPAT